VKTAETTVYSSSSVLLGDDKLQSTLFILHLLK